MGNISWLISKLFAGFARLSLYGTGLLATGVGMATLLPVAGLVGEWSVELPRLAVAAIACLAGATVGAFWGEAGRGPIAGLFLLVGGAFRLIVPFFLLAVGALCAGWVVSISTLLYSVVIYTLVVIAQSWTAAAKLQRGVNAWLRREGVALTPRTAGWPLRKLPND